MSNRMDRLFILNDPIAPRINPSLACEIGLNESLILLQIEFWISISNNIRDGRRWTYQSAKDIQEKAFPFWSLSTINRTLKSLVDNNYLIEGNFNEKKYDRTRWFSLNFEELRKLKSLTILNTETRPPNIDNPITQNDLRSNQNDLRSNQNDRPIPENTTESKRELYIPEKGTSVQKSSKGDENNSIDIQENLKEEALELLDEMPIKTTYLDNFIKQFAVVRKEYSLEELKISVKRYKECKVLLGEDIFHKPENYLRDGIFKAFLESNYVATLDTISKTLESKKGMHNLHRTTKPPQTLDEIEWSNQLGDLGF